MLDLLVITLELFYVLSHLLDIDWQLTVDTLLDILHTVRVVQLERLLGYFLRAVITHNGCVL